ncbi:MAG: sigma-70 family RNA polymerase sigma factor [Planctomycetota bacterium]
MDRAAGSLEERFARFQRSGDPEALASVFRDTAADLLKLAVQLTDDPAQAEDALQSTFVTAMEKAATFERGRPLLPWLCGVLQLHCKSLRARARRAADPPRLPIPEPKDPLETAMAGEIDRGLREAIDALPAPYRTAVVLRVLHGMEPAAIAHALGEAPGTLRVRLHRGLSMVRARLPRDIAAPALALPILGITPERGVDAIGREVFRHARRLLPTAKTAATVTVAALAMKKTAFAVLAVGLLVFAGVALSDLGSGDPRPATQVGAAPIEQRTQVVGEERAADAVMTTAADQQVTRSVVETPATAPEHRGIRVTARRPANGGPAAGVGITVLPHDGSHPDLHTLRRSTDADGVALFDDLPRGRYGVYVDRSAHEWKPEAPVDPNAQPTGAVISLGDGNTFRVSGVQLGGINFAQVDPAPSQASQTLSLDISTVLTRQLVFQSSGGDLAQLLRSSGEASLAEPQAPRDFKLSSRLPDRSPLVVVEVGDGYALAQVEVAGGIAVKGRVVDEQEQPIASAEVWVVRDQGRTAFAVATSKEDGSFALDDVDPGTTLFARKPDFVASGAVQAAENQDAVLKLGPRAASIRGRVTDSAGRAVAEARVRLGDPEQDEARRVQVPTDHDGRFSSPAPSRGRVPVLVLAAGFQPWLGDVEVGATDAAPLDIVLQPGGVIRGVVKDPNGKPSEGVLVTAKAPGQPDTDVRSGPAGTYRLECVAPGTVTLSVEAEGDHRGAELQTTAIAGREVEADIDLRGYGHLKGRLTDASGSPLRRATVYALPADPQGKPAHDRTKGDGSFEIRTIPGARYTIEVVPERSGQQSFQLSSSGNGTIAFMLVADGDDERPAPGLRRIPCTWLGEIGADYDGLAIQLPLDLVPSARIKGRALNPDATPLPGSLRIHIDGGSRDVGLDDNGAFDVGPLVPGTFRFEIVPTGEEFAPFDLPITHLAPKQNVDLGAVYAKPK